jgi:carboxypeptidase Q
MPPAMRIIAPAVIVAVAGGLSCATASESRTQGQPGNGPVDQLRASILGHSRAADWVRDLTDQVGPRLSGSPGDPKAVAWAVATMNSLGYTNVHAEKVMVPRWERGAEEAAVVSPVHQRLILTALGDSVPTPPQGIEADVVEVPTLEALDAMSEQQVHGKIVFFNKPTARLRTGEGYGKAVDVRGGGAVHAAKKGAVAVVIRSIATSNTRLPHTGAMNYADGVEKIPGAALAVPDAELLHRLLERGQPVRITLTLGCRTLPDAESANVIGDVVGRERPEEVVLLGAHLDSWDLGTGAIDDGAGVGAVLEAGRQIAAMNPHPRRTVRVVLFANEEHGLNGAFAYAKAHEAELGRHVVATEIDSGTGQVYAMSYLAGPDAAGAMATVAEPLLALGISPPQSAPHNGADLIPLRKAGVPVVSLQQDALSYFDYHHSADDTFDKVEPEKLAQVAAAAAVFASGAADATADFGRVPESMRESKGH